MLLCLFKPGRDPTEEETASWCPASTEHHWRRDHLNQPLLKTSCQFYRFPCFSHLLLSVLSCTSSGKEELFSTEICGSWGSPMLPVKHSFRKPFRASWGCSTSLGAWGPVPGWGSAVEIFVFSSMKTKLLSWLRSLALLTAFPGVLSTEWYFL